MRAHAVFRLLGVSVQCGCADVRGAPTSAACQHGAQQHASHGRAQGPRRRVQAAPYDDAWADEVQRQGQVEAQNRWQGGREGAVLRLELRLALGRPCMHRCSCSWLPVSPEGECP